MIKKISLLVCLLGLISVKSNSCTGISLKSTNNDFIQARTIEWGENHLNSKVIIMPSNMNYESILPTSKTGFKWKGKYGFVGASVSEDRFIGEGINEAGLNAGIFYFKNYGKLSPYHEKNIKKNITDMDLVKWFLSSFSTVEEVKEAIKNINIVPIFIENGIPSPTGHWRVSDAKGGNIVIEIINHGEIKVYENELGVITNAPDYSWHLTNLNNYVNLYPGAAKGFKMKNHVVFPFGTGSGLLGLPGDITPASRFVRAAFFVNTAPDFLDGESGIKQAFHILNNFDIPIGIEFLSKEEIPKDIPSATQWTSAVNQTEKKFYYKTMYNNQIRLIDLKKIDFSKIKYQAIPMDNNNSQVFKEINIK